jgi:hypothetical protein
VCVCVEREAILKKKKKWKLVCRERKREAIKKNGDLSIYIYIYREREREREQFFFKKIETWVLIVIIYICGGGMCVERERGNF